MGGDTDDMVRWNGLFPLLLLSLKIPPLLMPSMLLLPKPNGRACENKPPTEKADTTAVRKIDRVPMLTLHEKKDKDNRKSNKLDEESVLQVLCGGFVVVLVVFFFLTFVVSETMSIAILKKNIGDVQIFILQKESTWY